MADRPGLGDALLFPSPGDPLKATARKLANAWFREAEKLTEAEHGLTPMPRGRTFHGYRAKLATETKHLPDGRLAFAMKSKNTGGNQA